MAATARKDRHVIFNPSSLTRLTEGPARTSILCSVDMSTDGSIQAEWGSYLYTRMYPERCTTAKTLTRDYPIAY